MGSIIHRVATAGNQAGRSYLLAGSKAIEKCLSESGFGQCQIGMLINTGVYSDNNVQEPAFAALLQGNVKKRLFPGQENMFSYDLNDGGGGMIMAFRILDGFLESEKIELGLVVAGDAPQVGDQPAGTNYSVQAGAILLGRGKPEIGFTRFVQDSYPEYLEEFSSYTEHLNGELKSVINQSDKYLDYCLGCAQKSITRFLVREQLGMSDIGLVIPSQSPAGFAEQLCKIAGGDNIFVLEGDHNLYSAGLAFALEAAMESRKLANSRKTLFVTVGPGISVNLALYRS